MFYLEPSLRVGRHYELLVGGVYGDPAAPGLVRPVVAVVDIVTAGQEVYTDPARAGELGLVAGAEGEQQGLGLAVTGVVP